MDVVDYDFVDDSTNWRSTVDSSSGRTYWYHRKTRISTWIMPQCLVDMETSDTEMDMEIYQGTQNQKGVSLLQMEKLEEALVRDDGSLNVTLNFLSPTNLHSTNDQCESINNLVKIITANSLIQMRHKALLNLCLLSSDRCFVASFFAKTRCWLSLNDRYRDWDDMESKLLLASLFCNLCVGRDTYELLLTSGIILSLTTQLETDFWGDDVDSSLATNNIDLNIFFFPDSSSESTEQQQQQQQGEQELLTERTIHTWIALISKGHALPAFLMLVLIKASFRAEGPAVTFIRRGAVAVLQSICTCAGLDQVLRDRARDCLLLAMSQSAHVRERVLDSLLDLSSGLSQLPRASGPDPSVVTPRRLHHQQQQQPLGGLGDEEEEGEDQEHTSTVTRETQLGYYDIVDNSHESDAGQAHLRQLHFHRDVEWIPTSGTSWSLSSILLWSRCPALRDLIGGFWEEGGAGLELSIRACDEVLSSLCRYIHSGILLLPPGLNKRLQLLRVAAELGMPVLYGLIRPAIAEALTESNLSHILQYAEQNDLPDLHLMCDVFARSNGSTEVLEIRFGSCYQYSTLPTSGVVGRADRSSSESLRDAISESLQDVTEALRGAEASPLTRSATQNRRHIDDEANGFAADITMEDILMQSDDRSYRLSEEDEPPSSAWSDATLFVTAEEYRAEHSVSHSSPERPHRTQSNSSKAQSGKSGGIYGLLLQSQNQSSGSQSHSNPTKSIQSSKGGTPTKNPASVSSSAATTPRTQRATRLLAGARPSGVTSNGRSDLRDALEGPSGADLFRDERESSSGWDLQGATEFDNKMSLAPPRKSTAAERRLLDMAKPRKVSGKKPGPVPAEPTADDQGEDLAGDAYANAAPVPDKDRKKGKSEPLKAAAPASLDLPRTSSKTNEDKLAPKRAVSPMSTSELDANSSKVKQSLSLSGSTFQVDARQAPPDGSVAATDVPSDTAPLENVRGSLTLLKTRATRRRRSVAEVDDVGRGDDGATPKLGANVANLDFSQPSEVSPRVDQKTFPFSSQPQRIDIVPRSSDDTPGKAGGADVRLGGNEDDGGSAPTHECPDCGRRFNSGPFQKHVPICQKVFLQKRKAFDSSKMRIEAIPELKEILVGNAAGGRSKGKKGAIKAAPVVPAAVAPSASNKWREESNTFRSAMRAARDLQMAIASGAPLPPPVASAPDSSLTQCPHCARRFNDKAAERHISHCQNIRAKPSSLKRGTGVNASSGTVTPGYNTLAGSSNKSKKW